MDSPIYYQDWHWPMRAKALDEENSDFAQWIIFGEYADGRVDIHWATGGFDITCGIPRELADKIIETRIEFSRKCVDILNSQEYHPAGE